MCLYVCNGMCTDCYVGCVCVCFSVFSMRMKAFYSCFAFLPNKFSRKRSNCKLFLYGKQKKVHDHSHQKVEAEQKKVAPRRPNKTITIQPLKCVSSIHTENKKWFY